MAEISGKSSTQAVPVCNGISSASQNTGFWSACLNVLVMPLLTSDTVQGFCSFWAQTELLMQPSSPQDLDRREELSFWARVTIHGQSSVRGLQEKATTEASLLLRESWVLFSLLDFFNKLLLLKCIFKNTSIILQKRRIPEFCRGTLIVAAYCVRVVALSLPMKGETSRKVLQRSSARIRLIIIPRHLSLSTLGVYCISTSQL